jgi:CheY-like chemotaxis protein
VPKILIVDDNPVLLAVARASLEAAGFGVVTRESPLGFSATLQDESPDLALIDVLMPALAGPKLIEIIRPIRSRRGDGPLLILHSGIREAELQRLVTECGADGYILKSKHPGDLPVQVGRILKAKSKLRRTA